MGWAGEHLGAPECRRIAEELIAAGGGRVMREDSGRSELIALCPLHKERNPSFSYNYAKDAFNCSSGCGGGDLIALFGRVRGVDQRQAFKDFLAEFAPDELRHGSGARRPQAGRAAPRPAAEPAKIIPESDWDQFRPLSGDFLRELTESRGWSEETVRALDLRMDNAPPDRRRVLIPVRDERGRLRNIRRYRPGAASAKVISWSREQAGRKISYGEARLWPLEALA